MANNKDTVEISRKRWCRGGRTSAALKTETGQSCCLGFVARHYGLKTPVGIGEFCDLDATGFSNLPKKLRPSVYHDASFGSTYTTNTPLHDDLVAVNDDDMLEASEREAKITKLLAKAGVNVIFKD